jgi:hypothetical protein
MISIIIYQQISANFSVRSHCTTKKIKQFYMNKFFFLFVISFTSQFSEWDDQHDYEIPDEGK